MEASAARTSRTRHAWLAALLLLLLLGAGSALQAQGCSACRDTTAGSAPKARQGLRRGIVALGVPACGIVAAIALVGWRIEQRRESEQGA